MGTSKLIAVKDDINSHGAGQLIPGNPKTVYIENINVIAHPDRAAPDALCPPLGGPHCAPNTIGFSPTVYAYNEPIHCHGDKRTCGATTIVKRQSTVFADS